MTRLAIFDCDGTLVDGQAEVCLAMDDAFATAGLPRPDRHAVRRIVGLSLPQAVARLAPDADKATQAAAVAAYKAAYRSRRETGALLEPLYDGVAELLEALLDAGWLLGIATGKSERGLHACLASHRLLHHFITLQTADHHPSKPHPAMIQAALAEADIAAGSAVMIGDTAFDIEMAGRAGVGAIGVAWGYHEPDELRAAGAAGVAGDVAELGRLLGVGRG